MSEQQSRFSSSVKWLPCLPGPVPFKDSFSTATTSTSESLIQYNYGKCCHILKSLRHMCVYGGSAGVLYLSIRMESCDPWLRWIREPLLDTMRYWLVYPHEKVTLFFVACQKHAILAPRLFAFSQCRLVRTITDQLSCMLFNIRVCMVREALYVLFLFWSRGKHKAHFLRTVHTAKSLRFFYQFQRWAGTKRAELTL